MKKTLIKSKRLLIWLTFFLFSTSVLSEDASPQEGIAKYASVTIETNGLKESTETLQEAMTALSLSLKVASKSPENLSVEQMYELGMIIDKADTLVSSLEQTMNEVNPAINSAKQSTQELFLGLLQSATTEVVEPTIESIRSTVEMWILLMIMGLISTVALIGLIMYYMTKRLRDMTRMLQSISGEYEIVRRQVLS